MRKDGSIGRALAGSRIRSWGWKSEHGTVNVEFPREALATIVAAHEYAPFFVALCGDHLHGWATPRSPFVLHGAHIIPLRDVLGLFPQIKTVRSSVDVANRRVVLQSHDLKLFLQFW